jgi:ABC-type Fe3+-siderophore transport system permease subunit
MMSQFTSDQFVRWSRGAGLGALLVLVWATLVPGGLFWSAILSAGLAGATLATVFLVRSRSHLTLAQVIAAAETDPVVVARGEGRS